MVERCVRDAEVASSNLVASIGQTGNVGNGIFGSFFQSSFKENVSQKKRKKKLTKETEYSKIEKVVEAWLSLVERYIRDVEVASSNLVASTF